MGVIHACDEICPKSWGEGKEKCYKFIPKRMGFKAAIKECRRAGGRMFAPNDPGEMDQLAELARIPQFGLKWERNFFWIGFRIRDLNDVIFPPELKAVHGETPEWVSTGVINSAVWNPKVKTLIKSRKNVRAKRNLVRSNKGMWELSKNAYNGAAAAVCEIKKACKQYGDETTCWQPKSAVHDPIEYLGKSTVTSLGYNCAKWNDESQHEHNYLKDTDHNFCRNPDNGPTGPWCYVNKAERWDHCVIPTCKETGNEFVSAQVNCGRRPEMDDKNCYVFRVNRGRDARFGEVPYQARIRYDQKATVDRTDHIGGGALITSCWVLTAAKALRNAMIAKATADNFRVDIGNRYYQTTLRGHIHRTLFLSFLF